MNEFEQFLKSLELDDPKIKTITNRMEVEVKKAASNVEKDVMEKFKDYEELKDKASKASTLEKDLEKVNSILEEKSNECKTLEDTLEKSNKDWNSKLTNTIIDKEIEKALINIPNGELLKSHINKEEIKFDKKAQKAEGILEQIDRYKEKFPDVFNTDKQLSGQVPQQRTQSPGIPLTQSEVATWSQDKIMDNWDKVKGLFFK